MNIHEMTIEQLLEIKISTIAQGSQFADDILEEQIVIHRKMLGLEDKDQWQEYCNRHYELRKIRYRALHEIGAMVIKIKKLKKR